jgi:4-hydroxybenzoate polyprenyltransferase
MDQFGGGLYRMLFKFEVIRMQDNEYAVLIFAAGCAIIGLLTVVADVAFFMLRGQSLLDLKHGPRSTMLFCFAWALGALVIGYIGQVASIFQVSLLACATVGVGWPIVFTQLLEKSRKKEEIQQPTEEVEA